MDSNSNFSNEEYFLGTSGTRGNFSLLDLDTKFIDRTETVINYFDLKNELEGTIAEVGCGTAPFYRFVHQQPELSRLNVVCSDITEGGVNLLSDLDKPPFTMAGAEKLPYEDDNLLGIVEWDVLERIYHPDEAIREAHRALRAGGFLHIVCPNPESWLRTSSDPDRDPDRRDKSHFFPPIVTVEFLDKTLKESGFTSEIYTRGFEGEDGKNQTGIGSMRLATLDATGTHLVVFARKK